MDNISVQKQKITQIDVVVIGGGPAGLTAAIYIGRALLSCVVIESNVPGGKMTETFEIENYAGFPCVRGVDLSLKMAKHAANFGSKLIYDEVIDIKILKTKKKRVYLKTRGVYEAKAIVIASGTRIRKLKIPGEKQYYSHGVSTCAVCDGALYKDKIVAVIGAGDSATEEALYLTKFVSKIYLIHRSDIFRANKPNIEKVQKHPKINLVLNSVVIEINGDGKKANQIIVKNIITGDSQAISVSCVFPYIGQLPNNSFLKTIIKNNDQKFTTYGFVNVNANKCETSISGVFAAGDVINKTLRQVGNAVGEGTTAGQSAVGYVDNFSSE